MAWHLYSRGKASGTYLSLAPIFPTNLGSDIRWGFDAIWNISIITTAPATFEYTLDGGATYFPLGVTVANKELLVNIKADDKDSFNLRTTGGATVFRILVSIAPEDIQRQLNPVNVAIPVPLPVDICPVNCEIDVDINSISFGTIPVSITGQPIEVTWPSALPVDICPVTCDVPIINGSVTPLDVQVANVPGTPIGTSILSLTNSVYLANTDLSGVDLPPTGTSPGDAVIYRVQWSSSATGRLRYTLDGGTYVDFNNSINIKAESSIIFDVVVEDGDLFNLQHTNGGTIRFLRVIQLA